jgi:hypothetical protein
MTEDAMSAPSCERSDAVARSGPGDRELRDHAAQCPACQDALLVARFYAEHAHASVQHDERPLPDPRIIWWRAEIEARRKAAESAIRPIMIMHRVAAACGAIGTGAALWWAAPELKTWLASMASAATLQGGMANPVLVIGASLGVLAVIVTHDLLTAREG